MVTFFALYAVIRRLKYPKYFLLRDNRRHGVLSHARTACPLHEATLKSLGACLELLFSCATPVPLCHVASCSAS